jgi:CYTH domain-containing protein
MPEHTGWVGHAHLAVEQMQIGPADPAREHTQQKLAGLRLGNRPLDHAKRLTHSFEDHRAHDRMSSSLCSSMPARGAGAGGFEGASGKMSCQMSPHVEIERKFLIPTLPQDLERFPCSRIEQGYVAIDAAGIEVRIRRRRERTSLTIKGGSGRSRAEEEIEIDAPRFARLWALSGGRCLEKTRYEIPADGGLTIELDVYRGRLEKLATAEVEFASLEAAERFVAPPWFGKEVTDDDAYKNRRLAVDGRPADT